MHFVDTYKSSSRRYNSLVGMSWLCSVHLCLLSWEHPPYLSSFWTTGERGSPRRARSSSPRSVWCMRAQLIILRVASCFLNLEIALSLFSHIDSAIAGVWYYDALLHSMIDVKGWSQSSVKRAFVKRRDLQYYRCYLFQAWCSIQSISTLVFK